MNPNQNHHVTDEQLDRHIDALHEDPVPPDGPSPQALGATLSMLRNAERSAPPAVAVTGRRSFFERAVAMTFTQRIAAAVMITLGALTLYVVFGVFNAFSPSVAFADVANKLKGAQTIQYTSSVTIPGKPAVRIRTLVAEPQRMRTEMPDGVVSIMDERGMLMLNPKAKTATRTMFDRGDDQAPAPGAGKDLSLVTAMRSLGGTKGTPVGEQVIDGVPCAGFKIDIAGREMTVWANKKTADPVRLEWNVRAGGHDATMVMSEFVIDAPLDDALFSLEAPEGYKLEEKEFAVPKFGEVVAEVAGLLRAYTDKSEGGAFPADLFDWADFHKVTGDTSGKIGGVGGALFGRPNTYGYAGRGVKRGEKDKIVFWHQPDADVKTYRAVFGDLRVEEVGPERLPATRPATR